MNRNWRNSPIVFYAVALLCLLLSFLFIGLIQTFIGKTGFDNYVVRGYETAVSHYAILRVFILLKAIVCSLFCFVVLAKLLGLQKVKSAFIFSLILLPILYVLGVFKSNCDYVFDYLHSPYTIYEGRIFEFDSTLGKRAIPGATGFQDYWIKTDSDFRKEILIDSNGYRISRKPYPITGDSLLLFLGCSYTWGDGCRAEETYPYLVAKQKQLPYLNAAQSGYGLAQMALLAERLIPKYKPAYLYLQYSPWLADRAVKPFQPTVFFSEISFPYLAKKKEALTLQPPLFKSGLFDFDSEYYRTSSSTVFSRIQFYFDYGIKVMLHDQCCKIIAEWRLKTDRSNEPVSSAEAEQFLYDKILKLAAQYQCQVRVVNIGSLQFAVPVRRLPFFLNQVIINTDSLLKTNAHNNPKEYARLYYHWVKDTIVADVHPNKLTHSLIAKYLLGE